MRFYFYLLLIFILPFQGISQKKKILFVTTSIDTVNNQANGTFLMEIAYPFHYFTEKGYEVDIVSPKGGKIPIYEKFDTTEVIREIIENKLFIKKTTNSLLPAQVNTMDYIAVYYPGGYGQFWDLSFHVEIADITAKIYEQGGVVGSAGHGTSSLVQVKLTSSDYLVAGKTLTCFPSWFEQQVMVDADYGKLLPFDMEKELVLRGAHLKAYTKEYKENRLIVDSENRMVTGAFADDAEFVAIEMDKLIIKVTGSEAKP